MSVQWRGIAAAAYAGAMSDEPEQRPDLIARALATTIVATLIGLLLGKIFGKRVGFLAMLATAVGHEMFDAPVARQLSKLGI